MYWALHTRRSGFAVVNFLYQILVLRFMEFCLLKYSLCWDQRICWDVGPGRIWWCSLVCLFYRAKLSIPLSLIQSSGLSYVRSVCDFGPLKLSTSRRCDCGRSHRPIAQTSGARLRQMCLLPGLQPPPSTVYLVKNPISGS